METKITLLNGPKLSDKEADKKFNETRLNLLPYIKEYISNHKLFLNKEVNITFSHKGMSSLVSIIDIGSQKYIFKISLSKTFSFGEGVFLQVWEKAGVKVPHVFETGEIYERPYTLMEYIDAKILGDIINLYDEQTKKETLAEMGNILRQMHTPNTKGYGRCIENKSEFTTFREWLESPDMKTRTDYVQENMILTDEHGSLVKMQEILIYFIEIDNKSSYCHDDFGANNIFATKPLTIFDPNPRFNHGYIDLGRSLFASIVNLESEECRNIFVDSYFQNKPYNKKVLHASIMLAAYMKLPYSHKLNKTENIERIREYLINNKNLLEL